MSNIFELPDRRKVADSADISSGVPYLDPNVLDARRKAEADKIEDKLQNLKSIPMDDRKLFAVNLEKLMQEVSDSGHLLYEVTEMAGFGDRKSSKALYDYTLPGNVSLGNIPPSRLARLKKKPHRYLQLAKIAGQILNDDSAGGIMKLVKGTSFDALSDVTELAFHDREAVRYIEALITDGTHWIERNCRIKLALEIAMAKGIARNDSGWSVNRDYQYSHPILTPDTPAPKPLDGQQIKFYIPDRPKHWCPIGPSIWLGIISHDTRPGVRYSTEGNEESVIIHTAREISLLLTLHGTKLVPIFLCQTCPYIVSHSDGPTEPKYAPGTPTVVFPGDRPGMYTTWDKETHGLNHDLWPAVYESDGHLTFITPMDDYDRGRLIGLYGLIQEIHDGLSPKVLERASAYGIATLFVSDPVIEALYDDEPVPGELTVLEDPATWLGQSVNYPTVAINPNLAKLEAAFTQPRAIPVADDWNLSVLPSECRESSEITIVEALLLQADAWAESLFEFDSQITGEARQRFATRISKYAPSIDDETENN